MRIVFLNGEYLPMEQAKISPMDRGFLFGEGIYEVIPSYDAKLVGFIPHIQRMQAGLAAIEITLDYTESDWLNIMKTLMDKNGSGNLGLYLHVSRGTAPERLHAYPKNIVPTVFAFTFDIGPEHIADKRQAKIYKVVSTADLRWKRCQIKSTSLLGNVMHFQQGQDAGVQETILYNSSGQLTEASSCNVFVVKNQVITTPPLDNQLLPGITRKLLLDMLRKDGRLQVKERPIHMQEVQAADELWLTSSSKEIAPIVELDGKPVGNGQVGDIWLLAQALFNKHKYSY